MHTFVLVHGAFHGGWCYSRVARILRAAGHDVFTPTLTGLGERAHLAHMSINLSVHIEDVAALLRSEELSNVILCGHSYGGMVITGVAAAEGERIRTLVYLDAIVPEDGQSLFDVVGTEIMKRTVATAALDGRVPSPGAAFFNVNDADSEWVERRCVPQPIATFVEAVRLTGREPAVHNRTYMLASNYGFALNGEIFDRLGQDPAWRTVVIDAGHDMMIDAPEQLAQALLEEVGR
ncbi:alpha/beta fold hydrolase [Paraburkholderia sp. GAS32]|jgi:pimeloyl-ACP methyl ester carboxylesterase|uniref:alpha/beta fold hydrolase n=1 Tax=Paraburkholderia sp. GAS32 TaxID=3035129 RepID=UPI003D1E2752